MTVNLLKEVKFKEIIANERLRIFQLPNTESKVIETLRYAFKHKTIDEYLTISYLPYFLHLTTKEISDAIDQIFCPSSLKERYQACMVDSIAPLAMDPYLLHKVQVADLSIADIEYYFNELEAIRREIAEIVFPGITVILIKDITKTSEE